MEYIHYHFKIWGFHFLLIRELWGKNVSEFFTELTQTYLQQQLIFHNSLNRFDEQVV